MTNRTDLGVLVIRVRAVELEPGALREERTRLGLTQYELSQRLGLRPDTVSRWEKGQSLSLSEARRLGDALGLSVEFGDDSEGD